MHDIRLYSLCLLLDVGVPLIIVSSSMILQDSLICFFCIRYTYKEIRKLLPVCSLSFNRNFLPLEVEPCSYTSCPCLRDDCRKTMKKVLSRVNCEFFLPKCHLSKCRFLLLTILSLPIFHLPNCFLSNLTRPKIRPWKKTV